MCIDRSAEYLNWRYVYNPLSQYELLTARRGDSLLGYVVFHCETDDATLDDLFGTNDEIIEWLLWAAIALLRKRRVTTLSAPTGEWHPWYPLMLRLGFRIREKSPIVIYGGLEGVVERAWLLMNGDRDN